MKYVVCVLALWFAISPVMAQTEPKDSEDKPKDVLHRKEQPEFGKGPGVPIPKGLHWWRYAPDRETAEDYRLRLETQRRMVEDWRMEQQAQGVFEKKAYDDLIMDYKSGIVEYKSLQRHRMEANG